MVLHPEGRAVWNSSTSEWEYEYDVKDHLGNTRASFAPTTDKVKVLQTRDYYPFGLEFANWYMNDANATKFRYNGKELQDEGGLGWYDYGARFYDPSLGRWHSVDPHSENYLPFSPYVYVGNNPIIYIDPDGRDRRLIRNQKTKTITVKATYYHDINSTAGARAGVNVFNNMEGMKYTDSEGATWNVKFDLTTSRSRDPIGAAEKDPQGNSFALRKTVINPRSGKKVAGISINRKHTQVGVEFKDALTPAHEMGHTLGMDHTNTGVMTETSNHPDRNENITQENINQMIEKGKGPENHQRSFLDTIKNFLGI